MPAPGRNQPCPCGSGAKSKRCCLPLLEGAPAPTPERLMRSRYSAYATGRASYILDTTDPEGPHFQADRDAWRAEVEAFCRETSFEGLEVLEASAEGDRGRVRFRVTLTQGGVPAGFEEDSRFRRVGERWLYTSGG